MSPLSRSHLSLKATSPPSAKLVFRRQSAETLFATDSGSMRDVLEFVTSAGHEMLEQNQVGKDYIHIMRHK
jgi:hypothetical protein